MATRIQHKAGKSRDLGAESLAWVPAQPFLSLSPGEGELKPVPT